MDPEFSNKAKNFIRDYLLLNSDQNTESTSILENISELNITDQIKKLDSILTFKDLELQELTILDLILKKTKTIHDEVSRKKNKEEHNTIRRIQAKIQKLKKVVTEDKSELNLEKLKEAKVELKDFYYTKKLGNEAKIEEFVILKDGEINANLFNEIKEKKFKKKIDEIEFPNGEVSSDNKKIAESLTTHYKDCVENEKEMDNMDSFLEKHNIDLNLNIPSLKDLDKKITDKEIVESIKKLKPGAAPGISGMDRTFLLFIFLLIPTIFTEGINIYINKGATHKNFAWLKLRKVIFFKKANKDNNLPGSFRPISILECLFKVINRCIIIRIDNLSNDIFNKNQYGFIRNRSGASATRTIQTIQHAQQRSNENYSIVFLDNKQAFLYNKNPLIPLLPLLIFLNLIHFCPQLQLF